MKQFEFVFTQNFDKFVNDLFINKNIFEIYIIINNLILNSIILNINIFNFIIILKIFNKNDYVLIIIEKNYYLKRFN